MTHAPNDYALIIGIDHYPAWPDGAKNLEGPSKDAIAFRDWLTGDPGGGLPEENIRLIVSSAGPPNPLQSSVDEELGMIGEISKGKERRRFYFYFSGHGHSPAMTAMQQALCLANWSRTRQGAALNLGSYVNAAVGCLGFGEGLYFVDCCRVRAIAPIGRISDFECGDPTFTDRHYAILYGTEHYMSGYEGPQDEDVRGYFTAALLDILWEGPIELKDLNRRLWTAVPERAKPKDQVSRMIDYTAREIMLGRAAKSDAPPPPPTDPEAVNGTSPPTLNLAIEIETNLHAVQDSGELPPPRPGEILVLRDGTLLAQQRGAYHGQLPAGRYKIVVMHGEAVDSREVDLQADRTESFNLPRRRSAAPLSSTADKHEWLTMPIEAGSCWNKSETLRSSATSRRLDADQAIFIARRKLDGDFDGEISDHLEFLSPDRRRFPIDQGPMLIPAQVGTYMLTYIGPGGPLHLPIPVAESWDTQVFLIETDGRLQLERASIFMRPAGKGFDPGDALLDAYERALADLASGGPSPEKATLNNLLYGKWRNPLFGLVGAHFLVRSLRPPAEVSVSDLDLLDTVIGNLSKLMGDRAPDIVALRVAKALLIGDDLPAAPANVPLFRAGLNALIEATALQADWLGELEDIALFLVPTSPWSCWNEPINLGRGMSASRHGDHVDYHLTTVGEKSLEALEFSLRAEGLEPKRKPGDDADAIAVTIPEARFSMLEPPDSYRRLANIPDWLVNFVADELARVRPYEQKLDLAALTRRTGLPRRLLETAIEIAEISATRPEESDGMVEESA